MIYFYDFITITIIYLFQVIFKLEIFVRFPDPMLYILWLIKWEGVNASHYRAQYGRTSIGGGAEMAKMYLLSHSPLMIVYNIA